jgi:serine/threonine protein kinase/Tol biopolymer transport system component
VRPLQWLRILPRDARRGQQGATHRDLNTTPGRSAYNDGEMTRHASLAIGSRIGGYELVALLGAGGMGEVYRAHDPRLRRDVAVKILPSASGADPDAIRRFEQEACAAAALNHPNILTVHQVGTAEGIPFIVSELLDGETLRVRLARGPLPVRTATDYTMQILSGLAAAHGKGIVHRDLKPENVFLCTDGRVKILDFGLVKLLRGEVVPAGDAGLSTRLGDTAPGMVLGTIGYMSPEQVRGHVVDQRTDIFSVGAVLYEMLRGERAFQGDSSADVMSAILNAEPGDLSTATHARVSPALDRIIRHCLEKEPVRRFQAARDVALALDAVSGLSGTTAVPVAKHSVARRGSAAAAIAGAGVVCVLLGAWIGRATSRPSAVSAPLVQDVTRVTHDIGFSEWPTWSPDGRMFAFSSNRAGNFDIYLARIGGSQELVNVTRDAYDNIQPAFSPDGSAIAFVSTRSSRRPLTKIGAFGGLGFRTVGGDVWVIPALGGQARRVAEAGNFPVWSPDGRSVAYVSGEENHRSILSVPVDGGQPRSILASDASSWEIVRLSYSPDGHWITFETADAEIMIMPAAGGTPSALLRGRAHTWSASVRTLYYVRATVASRIEAADLTENGGTLGVRSVRIIGTNTVGLQQMALAPDGEHVLVSDIQESLNLARIALSPAGDTVVGVEEGLDYGQARDDYPRVSPSGKRILFASDRTGMPDLWTVDLDSKEAHRVELPRVEYDAVVGCWAGDDHHIVAMTVAGGENAYWRVALDGSATDPLVAPGPGGSPVRQGGFACALSPDGRSLLYPRLVRNFTQLLLRDLATNRDRTLTTSATDKYDATWSPDGRWVTFARNSDGGVNVWRIPASGGEEQPLTSGPDRTRHFFYSPDGRWLYIQPNHRNIYRMPAEGGPREPVTHFPDSSALFIEEPSISPDGKFIVYGRDRGGSSLWMLTLKAQ